MIKTLKLHNFGKIKDLEIDCANKNVYIVGQNGSGKTTILQAISLALTGKVAKGLTNDLFIGPYDKDFTVVLELDDGTKIGRTAKGAKLQLPNGAIFKKVKDVYEHLGFDPALLFNLSYVRQGEIADLFMSGNGKGVIDKLSSLIIDAKRMSEGNLELGRKIKTLESDIVSIQNGMKQNLEFMKEFNIDEIERNITTYSNMIKTLLESKKYSNSEINKFYNMYSQFEILSYNLTTQKKEANYYKDLFNKLTKPEITVIELKDKQAAYKEYAIEFAKINDIDNEIARYKVVENYVDDVEKYISTKFYRVDYTEDDLMRINAAENDMMDCLSTTKHFNDVTLAEEFLKNYNSMDHVDAKTLLENKKLKEYLVNRLKPFRFEVQYIRSIKANNPEMHSRDIVLNHITELEKDKLTIINKYKNPPQEVTDKEIWDIDQQWKTYNDAEYKMKKSVSMCNDTYEKYCELSEKIKTIPTKEQLDEMKDIEKNIAQYEDMLQVWEDKKSMYNKCILNSKTREKQIKDTEEEMERVSYWKDIFSDTPNRLRAVLFNPVVEILNKEFYELFSFSGLGEINIDWNKVTITIGEKKFEQLSGAQMVAVGLSLRLALLKVMGECVPIMLVDEPTTFLDDDRKNDIQKLLSHMSTVSQCIVSTHDDNIISANSVVINLNK
jgi:DNA repair exonuclease SbcCD ATPase subunit